MMRNRRPLLAAVLLAGACLAGCATPPGGSAQADELLASGDYDGAFVRYALVLAQNPDDEETARKMETARQLAWGTHRERASEALDRGGYEDAAASLRRVVELNPRDEEAARRLEEIEGRERTAREAVDRARGLLESGDPRGALDALNPHLAILGSVPDALEVLQEAEKRLHDAACEEALDALNRRDFTAARRAARQAVEAIPTSGRATALLRQAEGSLEALELSRQAGVALERGDYRSAIGLQRRALSRSPGLAEAEAGLSSALAEGARANVEAAARSLESGDMAEAMERLEAAEELDPGVAGREGLEARIRTKLAEDLVARGDVHARAGRPALALLHLDRARAIRPDLPELDARLDAARTGVHAKLRVRLRIGDLRNATGKPLDALGIGRSAVDRMLADGLLGWAEVEGEEAAGPVDWTFSGEVTKFVVRRSRPVSRVRPVRYVKSRVREPNPEYEAIERDLRGAEYDAREAEFRLAEERRRHQLLIDNPWDAWHLDGSRGSRSRPAGRVRYSYESALLVQGGRLRTFERRWNVAVEEVTRLRGELATVSPTIERPVYATHRYRERLRTVSGRAEVALRLTPATVGREVEDEVYAGFRLEDTEGPGFEPAGLAPDPDELPSHEEAADHLGEELVVMLAKRMRDAVESLAKRHLEAAEAAPDETSRQEAWALFLLSGARGEGRVREDVRRDLREATGLVVPPLPSSIREED
jgi:tetratricopeptide (TPR) repeat protein